jgi:hypothetical protein
MNEPARTEIVNEQRRRRRYTMMMMMMMVVVVVVVVQTSEQVIRSQSICEKHSIDSNHKQLSIVAE